MTHEYSWRNDKTRRSPGKHGLQARRRHNAAREGDASKTARVSGRQTRNQRKGAVQRPQKAAARPTDSEEEYVKNAVDRRMCGGLELK